MPATPTPRWTPIPAAAQLVTALQQIVAREIDPAVPAVLTVGSISGGTRHNVIASSVQLQGTMRTVDPDVRELLIERLRAICEAVATGQRRRGAGRGSDGLGAGITAPLHSPHFDLDEAALPLGVAVLADAVRRLLVGSA